MGNNKEGIRCIVFLQGALHLVGDNVNSRSRAKFMPLEVLYGSGNAGDWP